ncbi:MAG: DUF721 domain-containing protein [Candidatus Hydrogenedentes bacterium]|jgi:predicted nucleic acid-binding Zn ribbon protein|nr:DUF721 domain-containing protein [Candidatus Hydrogenedentota bacterium]
MSDTKPKAIGEILASLKESGKLSEHFEYARIWERWPEVVGSRLMPYGRPLRVRDKRLTIEIDGAVWMHRFSYRTREIIAGANRVAGREIVTDVFLVLAGEGQDQGPQDRA